MFLPTFLPHDVKVDVSHALRSSIHAIAYCTIVPVDYLSCNNQLYLVLYQLQRSKANNDFLCSKHGLFLGSDNLSRRWEVVLCYSGPHSHSCQCHLLARTEKARHPTPHTTKIRVLTWCAWPQTVPPRAQSASCRHHGCTTSHLHLHARALYRRVNLCVQTVGCRVCLISHIAPQTTLIHVSSTM